MERVEENKSRTKSSAGRRKRRTERECEKKGGERKMERGQMNDEMLTSVFRVA